jgi:hypothetical protein
MTAYTSCCFNFAFCCQSGARKDPTMSAMAALAAGKEQAIADWLAKQ